MKILRYRSLEEIPNYHKKSVPIDTINFLIFTLISIKKKKRESSFSHRTMIRLKNRTGGSTRVRSRGSSGPDFAG